jgi:hypothetical protein
MRLAYAPNAQEKTPKAVARTACDLQFNFIAANLTAHNNLRGASRATIRRRASVAALAAEAAGLRTAPASGSLWS